MLLIILPVMGFTAWFAWHYRGSNSRARYEPEWDHSTKLELLIWGAPLLIIICLGALTWMGTHLLDPYRALARTAATNNADVAVPPLEVDVVALDWKWLFILPQYGVATVNDLAAPLDRPIDFHITASSVMNSFYIPALAGQIYAMPGMETKLHAVMNTAGTFEGISANYSGAGFSGMHFRFRGLSQPDFDNWIADLKKSGGALGRSQYLELETPTENEPIHAYGTVDPLLYKAILNLCVEPGKMCSSDMMAIDVRGGLGLEGVNAVLPRELAYDKYVRRGSAVFGPAPQYVVGICSVAELGNTSTSPAVAVTQIQGAPLLGAGLRPPFRSAIHETAIPADAPARRTSNS